MEVNKPVSQVAPPSMVNDPLVRDVHQAIIFARIRSDRIKKRQGFFLIFFNKIFFKNTAFFRITANKNIYYQRNHHKKIYINKKNILSKIKNFYIKIF